MRRAARVVLVLLALALLVLLGLTALNWRQEQRERAEIRRANAERMGRATAEAQACISDIARRDPRADAAADAGRGDPTPIGIVYRPQEDAETIGYPEVTACRGFNADYEPTGKWFTRTRFASTFFDPPNKHRCVEAAYRYAAAYNAEMVRLAPRAVARFCRRQVERFGGPGRR